jgi:hypothetical protein
MYITQEIPIIKNKMVYFVGSSDLEIANENEITDLILTMKGFLYSLENQKNVISELSENDLDIFYNKVYQAIQDFVKIKKRMQYYQYFGNTIIRDYFDTIITELKEFRKVLLKIIEGDLVEGVQKISQQNIAKRLNNN